MAENSAQKDAIEELISTGSEIASGAAATAIGFLSAGIEGAIVGGASGPLLTKIFCHIGQEIKDRFLGSREKVRIGATFAFAVAKIQENIKQGQKIREDDFFKDQPEERATAKEILEGILLASQREHEEKKCKFYGSLYANIAFHPEIDRAQANLLIRLAERLSYRQLCLLALFAKNEKFGLRQGDYRGEGKIVWDRVSLLQEIYELYVQNMLNASGEALLGLGDVNPDKMKIQGTGAFLYNLMELWAIDKEDLEDIAKLLR